MGKFVVKLFVLLAVVAVLAIAFFNFAWPQIAPMVGSDEGVVFTSANSTSGHIDDIKVDFATPILRESRTKRDLVVLEQDVETSSTVSSVPANIDLFKKSTTVHSFGTGVFTVDLASITADSISQDDEARQVTVLIPHACLQYITEDLDRTEFEATERGLLAFGELTLTQNQQAALEQTIRQQMVEELTSDACYEAADQAAIDAVYAILAPVVEKVDDSYGLSVTFDEKTENLDLVVEEGR